MRTYPPSVPVVKPGRVAGQHSNPRAEPMEPPDGAPLPGAPAADRAPGPVRQIVRRAARGAYRHGVQRVAPVIRRMGEL